MSICLVCNDTHIMNRDEYNVLCTHCPLPCPQCANGPFCVNTPCQCNCHEDKDVQQLQNLEKRLKTIKNLIEKGPHIGEEAQELLVAIYQICVK